MFGDNLIPSICQVVERQKVLLYRREIDGLRTLAVLEAGIFSLVGFYGRGFSAMVFTANLGKFLFANWQSMGINDRRAGWAAGFGLLLIVFAIVSFRPWIPFPSAYTLVTTKKNCYLYAYLRTSA